MLINVTQEDINAGQRCDAKTCPIALAAFRMQLEDPYVAKGTISYGVAVRLRRNLPPAAQQFVYDFDHRNDVKPFSFELED